MKKDFKREPNQRPSQRLTSGCTHQEVFLYLLVKLVESLLSSVHGGAGLVVAPPPLVHVALVQVLVGQDQRAEAVARVLLDSF